MPWPTCLHANYFSATSWWEPPRSSRILAPLSTRAPHSTLCYQEPISLNTDSSTLQQMPHERLIKQRIRRTLRTLLGGPCRFSILGVFFGSTDFRGKVLKARMQHQDKSGFTLAFVRCSHPLARCCTFLRHSTTSIGGNMAPLLKLQM